MNQIDRSFMKRALSIAARGRGFVSPNPCVGCVIVKNGKVLSEGYHSFYGGAHAEINAIQKAKTSLRGATIYINLEPCTHWGKTPPCTPQVIKSGIKRIFIAMLDPNPLVKGRGIKALKKAGINVHVGLGQKEAEELNKSYIHWRKTKLPYVILKTAMSLDGKIATYRGDSQWISNPLSRRWGHKLRSASDAILVGRKTVEIDNPKLTSHGMGKNPLRIILDPSLKTPISALVFSDKKPTLVIISKRAPKKKISKLMKSGIQFLRLNMKSNRFNVKTLLKYLGKSNVSQLLLEGGGETSWTFIKNKLVNEIAFFISPKIIGGRSAATPVEGEGFDQVKKSLSLDFKNISRSGTDILIQAIPSNLR
jgi:diaminohydroxyphosphoribosylaminopyrimidine deaminase/5-amino-6-(5-phosphoribosylamino)uracil reductase